VLHVAPPAKLGSGGTVRHRDKRPTHVIFISLERSETPQRRSALLRSHDIFIRGRRERRLHAGSDSCMQRKIISQ
jgi:hypothetical protein